MKIISNQIKPSETKSNQTKQTKRTQTNIGLSPFPVIVTTRIVSCLVGDSYKPSFATITGKGDNPKQTQRNQTNHQNRPRFTHKPLGYLGALPLRGRAHQQWSWWIHPQIPPVKGFSYVCHGQGCRVLLGMGDLPPLMTESL